MKHIPLHLLHRPPRAVDPTCAALQQARDAVYRAVAPLSLESSRLAPGQRQRLSGHLSSGCAAVVASVAEGLAQAPQRFPDVPLAGAALQRAQDEATAALRLHRCLSYLAELAYDHYVAQQAACAVSALAVLRQVEGVGAAPFSSLSDRLAREDAVREALEIHQLHRHRARSALLVQRHEQKAQRAQQGRKAQRAQQALKSIPPRSEP